MGGAASGGGLECQGYCGLGWLKSGELIQVRTVLTRLFCRLASADFDLHHSVDVKTL